MVLRGEAMGYQDNFRSPASMVPEQSRGVAGREL